MTNGAENAVRSCLTSVKENLMTGVLFTVPFMTIGGIFLALGYVVASLSNNIQDVFNGTETVGWLLTQISVAGLTLMVPVLGVYITYTIANHPGLVPGFVLSYIVQQGNVLQAAGDVIGLQGGPAGAGYLDAVVAGLLTGIVTRWFKQRDVPESIAPMTPVLLIPIATATVLTPVTSFMLDVPISIADAGLAELLSNMQGGGQAILLGDILGVMMAADMGGPINKVAYVFSVGFISEDVTAPMAAVVIAEMIPPINLALSDFIAPQKYAAEMYENAKSGVLLSFSFITEDVIPYVAVDPTCVIPSVVAGSVVAGTAPMALGMNTPAPHGGILVVPLSNQPFMFIAYILPGSIVTAVIATAIRPNFDAKMAAQSSDN